MTLIWRVLPVLFLANTVFAKVDYDILAYSYCINQGLFVELGRIKKEKYQVSLFHRWELLHKRKFSGGWHGPLDDLGRANKEVYAGGGGFLGFGKRKLLAKDGSHERGFLIWPLAWKGLYQRPDFYGLAQFYYRVNTRFVAFEAGIIGTIYSTDPIARIYLGFSR